MVQKKDETKCPICGIMVKRKHYSEYQIRYHGLIYKYSNTLKKKKIQKQLNKYISKKKIYYEDINKNANKKKTVLKKRDKISLKSINILKKD